MIQLSHVPFYRSNWAVTFCNNCQQPKLSAHKKQKKVPITRPKWINTEWYSSFLSLLKHHQDLQYDCHDNRPTGEHTDDMMQAYDEYKQLHNSAPYGSSSPLVVAPDTALRSRTMARRSRVRHQLVVVVLLALAFGVLVTLVNIYQLRLLQTDGGRGLPEGRLDASGKRPIVWVNGKRLSSGYLRHVFQVFDRIGYVTGDETSDWDVLWAHDYPFVTYKHLMLKLKPHQKVNHFPGSGFLTNKLNLVSSHNKLDFVPRAFRLPKDKDRFLTYAFKHQDKKWIQKSNNHRGIRIKNLPDLDLTKEGTFVQEFVDQPYLVDGRRFDIGIYTTITSINPLRVYIFDGDWLIRFCPEPFYPFDETIVHKYVVTDDYMPPWEVPSLKGYYEDFGYNRKQSLFAHLRKEGLDPEELTRRILRAIRITILDKEPNFIQSTTNYPTSKNFFEMVRFDFVLDKELNVYLMEVNMSPNLSSGHFPPNRLLYEQVIWSMLNLVGVARTTDNDITRGSSDEKEMQVCPRDVQVYPSECASPKCRDSCRSLECKLCHDCLKADQVDTLERAFLEHHNRKTWKRVFPETYASQKAAQDWSYSKDSEFSSLSAVNQWLSVWYRGKCIEDATWCV